MYVLGLDEARKHRQIPTRKGHKKAVPTQLTSVQAVTLKKVTTHPEQPRTREHDMLLTYRAALLMGLFIEHALRCSEVALLTIDSIDLYRDTIRIYRPKTDRTDIQKLHKHTRVAAQAYLSKMGREREVRSLLAIISKSLCQNEHGVCLSTSFFLLMSLMV